MKWTKKCSRTIVNIAVANTEAILKVEFCSAIDGGWLCMKKAVATEVGPFRASTCLMVVVG